MVPCFKSSFLKESIQYLIKYIYKTFKSSFKSKIPKNKKYSFF